MDLDVEVDLDIDWEGHLDTELLVGAGLVWIHSSVDNYTAAAVAAVFVVGTAGNLKRRHGVVEHTAREEEVFGFAKAELDCTEGYDDGAEPAAGIDAVMEGDSHWEVVVPVEPSGLDSWYRWT
jgi:hypothetical protein